MTFRKMLVFAITLVLLLLAGCGSQPSSVQLPLDPPQQNLTEQAAPEEPSAPPMDEVPPEESTDVDEPSDEPSDHETEPLAAPQLSGTLSVETAGSYEAIYAAITEVWERAVARQSVENQMAYNEFGPFDDDFVEDNASIRLQTDGTYLYLLQKNLLRVVSASGEDSTLVAEVDVSASGQENLALTPMELFVFDGRAVVVLSAYSWQEVQDEDGRFHFQSKHQTLLRSYDLSDPAQLSLDYEYIQDGTYQQARLVDGVLYVVSGYSLWDFSPEQPETYIPETGPRGQTGLLPATQIELMRQGSDVGYTVFSAASADLRELTTRAIFGAGGTAFWNETAVYFVTDERFFTSDAQQVRWEAVSCVYRLGLQELSVQNACAISGEMVDLDLRDGQLRFVLNQSETVCRMQNETLLDTQIGKTAAVCVLSADLQQKDAAAWPEETASGARFFDNWIVMDAQTAFALELSDLNSPLELEASSMLHAGATLYPYEEETFLASRMGDEGSAQLSLVDASTPGQLEELASLTLQAMGSEAINARSLLLLPEQDLIGLPTEDAYVFLRFGNGTLFVQSSVELTGGTSAGICCGAVNGEIYLCSSVSITVLEPDTLQPLCKLMLAEAQG